jgi:streptogramin lyase
MRLPKRQSIAVALSILMIAAACTHRRSPGHGALSSSNLSEHPAAVAAGLGHVWVVDDREGALLQVDRDTGKETRRLAIAGTPIAVTVGFGSVWVASILASTVTRVDPVTLTAVAPPIPVGQQPVSMSAGPDALWVVGNTDSSLTRIDPGTNTPSPPLILALGAVRVAASRDRVWVTNGQNTVARIDPRTMKLAGQMVPTGPDPIGVAIGAGSVWVANSNNRSITRIDERTGKVLDATIPVGISPLEVAVGIRATWAVNGGDNSLSEISIKKNAPVGAAIDLGAQPRGITFDNGRVWIVSANPSRLSWVDEVR